MEKKLFLFSQNITKKKVYLFGVLWTDPEDAKKSWNKVLAKGQLYEPRNNQSPIVRVDQMEQGKRETVFKRAGYDDRFEQLVKGA